MTYSSSLAALIEKEISRRGATSDGMTAPFLIWDGYGLGGGASGVATYGRELHASLAQQGVTPVVIMRPGESMISTTASAFQTTERAGIFSHILGSKPVWPKIVAHLVDKVAGQQIHSNQSVVLHGLSNFNLDGDKRSRQVKRVLTVHDVIPLIEPKSVSKSYYLQLKWLLPKALAAADAVICVSDWTRSTLIERYPGVRGKTRVIRNGVAAAPGSPLTPERLKVCDLRTLYVARGEEYKQLNVYFSALNALPATWQGDLITDERGLAEAHDLAPHLIADGRLKLHSRVSQNSYEELFRTATVYVHCSRYEGFCLPVADALGTGLPVVYQRGSATDELLTPKISTSVAPDSSPSVWAESIEITKEMADQPGFAAAVVQQRGRLPTWTSAANSLLELYSGL